MDLTEKHKIESSLFDDPENQELWSVYGDLLLDGGDLRGEVMALEKRPFDKEKNRIRIREIFSSRHEAWFGGLDRACKAAGLTLMIKPWEEDVYLERNPKAARGEIRLEMGRGYIRKVYVGLKEVESLESLRALWASCDLRFMEQIYLNLRDSPGKIQESFFEGAPPFHSLRSFFLDDAWCRQFHFTGGLFPRLKKLNWKGYQDGPTVGYGNGTSPEILEFSLPQLNHLSLIDIFENTETCKTLSNLRLPQLKNLVLYSRHHNLDFYGRFVGGLAENGELPALQRLTLGYRGEMGELLEPLSRAGFLPGLKRLRLRGFLNEDGALQLLERREQFAGVKRLVLERQKFKKATKQSLKEAFGDRLVIAER